MHSSCFEIANCFGSCQQERKEYEENGGNQPLITAFGGPTSPTSCGWRDMCSTPSGAPGGHSSSEAPSDGREEVYTTDHSSSQYYNFRQCPVSSGALATSSPHRQDFLRSVWGAACDETLRLVEAPGPSGPCVSLLLPSASIRPEPRRPTLASAHSTAGFLNTAEAARIGKSAVTPLAAQPRAMKSFRHPPPPAAAHKARLAAVNQGCAQQHGTYIILEDEEEEEEEEEERRAEEEEEDGEEERVVAECGAGSLGGCVMGGPTDERPVSDFAAQLAAGLAAFYAAAGAGLEDQGVQQGLECCVQGTAVSLTA